MYCYIPEYTVYKGYVYHIGISDLPQGLDIPTSNFHVMPEHNIPKHKGI